MNKISLDNSRENTIFSTFKFLILYFLDSKSLQIGLAVGDIEAVQRNARLKRLAMQVRCSQKNCLSTVGNVEP